LSTPSTQSTANRGDQIVEVGAVVEVDTGNDQLFELAPGIAAGDVLGAHHDFFDDETEGQGRDRQVHALHAQRRQADHDAGDARHQCRQRE
jgi:hypothetical protein